MGWRFSPSSVASWHDVSSCGRSSLRTAIRQTSCLQLIELDWNASVRQLGWRAIARRVSQQQQENELDFQNKKDRQEGGL